MGSRMGSKTILIADEYGFRLPLRFYLKNWGYNVAEASNKEEVFEKITEADILIMDVFFDYNFDYKEGKGIYIVKELRNHENEKIRSIPVIFTSTLTENMCADELKNIGPYVCLQKPLEPSTLSRELKRIIDSGAHHYQIS